MNDQFGFDLATCYAKRAVCQRIDAFTLNSHLRRYLRKKYPQKIDALREIGISIPDIVRRWVIQPRNDLEHQYDSATIEDAQTAIEIADLLLRATAEEAKQGSIIAIAWSVLGLTSMSAGKLTVQFDGFGPDPMLFVDILEKPEAVKIVIPRDSEVILTPLADFPDSEARELARFLRQHWSVSGRGDTSSPAEYYCEVKRQAGI